MTPGGSAKRWPRRLVWALWSVVIGLLLAEGVYRAVGFVGARSHNAASTFEIYAIGGSSMRGVPFAFGDMPPFSPADIAATMLQRKAVTLQVLAADGESIYPQTMRLVEALGARDRSRPGAVLIYSGHNEWFDRYPRRPGERPEWLPDIETERRVKFAILSHSRVLSALTLGVERALQLRGQRDLDHYEFYLRRAVEASLESGLIPILSTVAGNVAGIEPCIDLSTAQREAPAMEVALALQQNGDCAAAIQHFQRLATAAPRLAPWATHRIAQCQLAREEFDAARASFATAYQHLDCPWSYASTAQNDIVRRLAAEYRVPLVDAVAVFEQHAAHGILDNALFADGIHPNLRGHLLLGQAFGAALGKSFQIPLVLPDLDAVAALRQRDGPLADLRRVRAHLHSGFLLANWAIGQGRPHSLLALARTHVTATLALAPDTFAAWVLQGLLEARDAVAFFQSPQGNAWLHQHHFHETGASRCEHISKLVEIERKFKEIGASAQTVAQMRRTAALAQSTCNEGHHWAGTAPAGRRP